MSPSKLFEDLTDFTSYLLFYLGSVDEGLTTQSGLDEITILNLDVGQLY